MFHNIFNTFKARTQLIFILIFALSVNNAHSQEPAVNAKDTGKPAAADKAEDQKNFMEEEMTDIDFYSLEELLNTTIVSASKSEESAFDAPISSTVITKIDIEKSGVTTIGEALRLAPGMLVFEQTNGNYDIHIRGFNNVPPNSDMMQAVNTITLVMIDGRPVFNYFSGGTIWETLPIDLNDVERIEVVRGASSALYGPNAASGVINIITRRNPDKEFHSSANIYGGNYSTYIGNASAGYAFGDLGIIVSGNYQRRNRYNQIWYSFGNNQYVTDPEYIMIIPGTVSITAINNDNDIDDIFPYPELSMEKKACNIFLTYNPDKDIKLDLSGGYQSSIAQASLLDTGGSPLSFRTADTYYAHLVADLFGFTGQFSYFGGTLNTLLGNENNITKEEGDVWEHDAMVVDGQIEYNYKHKTLILRPGVSHRSVVYDGEYIGGKKKLTDSAAFIRAEYTFFDAWRLITALRGDKYNHPDDPYLSYQFITTYKFNKNNITRAYCSRAHREAFMDRAYMDFAVDAGPRILELKGNPDLDLLTVDVYEIGHRTRILENLECNLEIFYTTVKDFSLLRDTYEDAVLRIMQHTNTDTTAEQTGSTLSLGLVLKELQIKIFGTIQRTRIQDYYGDSIAFTKADTNNYSGTPGVFGGFYINYQPIAKLNLNLNGYYAQKYTFDYRDTESGRDGNVDIADVMVLNARVMYYVWEKSSVYVNARNMPGMFGREEREFPGGDRVGMLIMGGASLEI